MFFVLSKLLDVFLSPFTWALFLVAYALPWRRARHPGSPRARRALRRKRVAGLLGLAILLFFSSGRISNAMLYRLEHAQTSTFAPDVVYDAVILLGGISDEHVVAQTGQPSYNDNVERLTETNELLATGRARFVVISGGAIEPRLDPFSEARVLGAQLERWGIDPARIVLETKARNTRENALFTREIIAAHGWSRVLMVTSAFHMRRAIECFVAVGQAVDTLAVDYRATAEPEGVLPRAQFLAESTATLREITGLYIYRLKGYGKPLR